MPTYVYSNILVRFTKFFDKFCRNETKQGLGKKYFSETYMDMDTDMYMLKT